MGTPMSTQLVKAGYEVMVYNRSKHKEESLQNIGAKTASTPAELMQSSDMIFIMVSDDKAISEIFTEKDGLLSARTANRIIVNMSTVSPVISREMASLCLKQGNHYLDAPVSGSVKQAQDGQLVIMAGGEQNVFETVKPVLDKIGKLTIKVGEVGAGNSAKLAINALLGIFAQGLAEAVVFAQNNSIKKEDFFALINNSALGSAFSKIKGDAIINNNYKAAFALKHIVKDLKLAKAQGLSTPLGNTSLQNFEKAKDLYGEEDIIAIIKLFIEGI